MLVERTSKSLKGQGCVAIVGFFTGVLMALLGGQSAALGVIIAFASLAWLLVVKVLTWWRHG